MSVLTSAFTASSQLQSDQRETPCSTTCLTKLHFSAPCATSHQLTRIAQCMPRPRRCAQQAPPGSAKSCSANRLGEPKRIIERTHLYRAAPSQLQCALRATLCSTTRLPKFQSVRQMLNHTSSPASSNAFTVPVCPASAPRLSAVMPAAS